MNLVTGATGILGSHVVLALIKQGQPVVACRQTSSSTQAIQQLFEMHLQDGKSAFESIQWLELDVRDNFAVEDALQDITHVYHCAGFVSLSSNQRQKLIGINEVGTRNLVNACLTKPSVSLCHVSSIATINNSDYNLALNEEVFWKKSGNESAYALSKYNAEREVWRGIEEGLKAFIVNPGVILAPMFWHQSSSRLLDSVYKGNKYCTDGSAPYVAADDVAEIMIRLMTKEHFGERYILIENNYSFKDISQIILKVFHPGYAIKLVSKKTLKFLSIFENVISYFRKKEPVLTKSLIQSAFNKQSYSNKKIVETLNYDFIPVNDYLIKLCETHLKSRPSKN